MKRQVPVSPPFSPAAQLAAWPAPY
jgi:hypothetical protein